MSRLSGILFALGAAVPFVGFGLLLWLPFIGWRVEDPFTWIATFGVFGLVLMLAGLSIRLLGGVAERLRDR